MRKSYDEDDKLRKEFEDTFSGIHASEELKAHTLSQMRDGAEPKSAKTGDGYLSRRKMLRYSIPAAALLCAVIVLSFFKGTQGASYITDMEYGTFYDEVKLKDGEIRFVTNRVNISVTPNAGGITIGQEREEVTDSEIIEEKSTEGGGRLIYQKASEAVLTDPEEKNWSYIGEQKIYVTVSKTSETRYQAVFEKDGQVYELIGTAVTQKEFIDHLYRIIKK